MIIKSVTEFSLPENLEAILEEEGYWEDDSFEPILVTVEPVEIEGEEKISYQLSFETLDDFEEVEGDEWEEILRGFIREIDPDFEKVVQGDSESSTCVLWVDNAEDFVKLMEYTAQLLEDDETLKRLSEK